MSKPEPIDIYYYVDEHSDETLPCAARLDAWAEWLSKPDPDWPHAIPVDGEVFALSTMEVLANVNVTLEGGNIVVPERPPEAEEVYVRFGGPETGWDAEASCSFVLAATQEEKAAEVIELLKGWHLVNDGDSVCLAVVSSGSPQKATYRVGPPPQLVLGGAVQ